MNAEETFFLAVPGHVRPPPKSSGCSGKVVAKGGVLSASDYIVDILLVALVLRQVTPRPLTARSILLPAVLLAFAASQYLKGFPTAGNDVLLDAVLVAVGLGFGVLSGLKTKVWNSGSRGILCQAGVIAAAAWVIGMGIRFGFDIWAHTGSGAADLVRFSLRHSITSGDAWSTAFVLMAFAQVLTRVGILQYRRTRISAPARSMPELA